MILYAEANYYVYGYSINVCFLEIIVTLKYIYIIIFALITLWYL